MARPLLFQELTFSGMTQDSVAVFPKVERGQYVEYTVYVEFGAGVGAGKIQIETSFPDLTNGADKEYGGSWAAIGSTIDWSAASAQKYASITGVFADLRLRVDTAVTGGTARAYVVAASHPA